MTAISDLQNSRVEILAGKYQVIKELGSGSAGKVYLVKHPDLDVRYALKVLHMSSLDDPRFVDQFKREAQVLLKFSHEGCVQLRDFGKLDSGRYYMATDYIEGMTLRSLLQEEEKLPLSLSLKILVQILRVLVEAHKIGAVHRDLKPENIMLQLDQKDVKVKILDFGIAKLLFTDKSDQDNGPAEVLPKPLEISEFHSESGTLGTPGYMSPEQALGQNDLDERVDIYASGILAYEMLSGVPPFIGRSPSEIILSQATKAVPPLADSLGIPDSILSIIYKALARDRSERFRSAAEFLYQIRDSISKNQSQLFDESDKASLIYEEPTEASRLIGEISNEAIATKANVVDKKILLLDDDKTILTLMRHILESEGYKVFTASNCSSVQNTLFEEDIKIVITDIQMPDISGSRVCQMLKDSVDNLKIILFSNINERELEKLHFESKSDGWMSKNTKPSEWLSRIASILEH